MTGKNFGKWQVLKRDLTIKNGRAKWFCRCVCGVTKSVEGAHLRRGKTTQCNDCSLIQVHKDRQLDLSGKQFGFWTILSNAGRLKKREEDKNIYWKARCKCGFEKELPASAFSNSGGCRKCTNAKKSQHKFYAIFSKCKDGAIARSIDFQITIDDVEKLFDKQGGKCALTGLDLITTNNMRNYSKNTASLDRIDNSKGYYIDNIQFVHKDINRMKWVLSQEKFIDYSCKVADMYRNKIKE